MKDLNNFVKEAQSLQLTVVGLTASRSGYPNPDLGYFVHGFSSWSELESFAGITGCTPHLSLWKDGWKNVYSKGVADEYTLGTISSDWYGQDYDVLFSKISDQKYVRWCGYDSWEQMVAYEGESYTANKKEHYQELQEVSEGIDFKTHCIVLYCLEYVDVQPKNPLTFTHDTIHKALGVAWLWSEWQEWISNR